MSSSGDPDGTSDMRGSTCARNALATSSTFASDTASISNFPRAFEKAVRWYVSGSSPVGGSGCTGCDGDQAKLTAPPQGAVVSRSLRWTEVEYLAGYALGGWAV